MLVITIVLREHWLVFLCAVSVFFASLRLTSDPGTNRRDAETRRQRGVDLLHSEAAISQSGIIAHRKAVADREAVPDGKSVTHGKAVADSETITQQDDVAEENRSASHGRAIASHQIISQQRAFGPH